MILDAASRYDGMDEAAQRSLVEGARHDDSPVPEQATTEPGPRWTSPDGDGGAR